MKKYIKLQIFVGLLLSLFLPNIAFSQDYQGGIGITSGDKYVPVRVNAGNGFDTGVKGGSALQQLENIAGRNIDNSSTNTRTVVPTVKTISAAAAFQNSMRMQVASGIASAFFGMLFSSDNSQSSTQAIEARRQEAVLLAQRAAEEKRIADAIAQEKYDQMMKSYKGLNDPNNPNGLQVKILSGGSIQFKSLDQSAPLTMEERQLQNIRNKGISLTWNSNEWFNSSGSNMIEEDNTQEESDEYKKLDEISRKNKSEEGGREAEAVGIFMKYRIISTMSYLKDVSDAIASNNWSRLGALGHHDDAKVLSNDIKTSERVFGADLIKDGEKKVSEALKGESDAALHEVFGGVATKGMDLVPKPVKSAINEINSIIAHPATETSEAHEYGVVQLQGNEWTAPINVFIK
jgi:hypothetical protein